MSEIKVHDFFDGWRNCKDCDGICKLDESLRKASSFVAAVIGSAVYGKRSLSNMERFSLQNLGVDVEKYLKRAISAQKSF